MCVLPLKKPSQEHRSIVSVIRTVFYGDRSVFEALENFEQLSLDVLDQFTKMASPSEYLVDSIPICLLHNPLCTSLPDRPL